MPAGAEALDGALTALATSAGIGLLVGLERERNPLTKAGLRTFPLIAVLGAICTLLARSLDSGWIAAAGLAIVGGALAGAFLADPRTREDDSGTTTIVAACVVFGLGALCALGERQVAVAVGVATTALLYFKAELEGFSRKLTAQDLRTMLRFAILTAVVLPLLPDRPLAADGPLAALNPRNLWLMVVLISGASLAGYVAWRLTLGRHGLLLTGLLGGLASSTATTLVAARHVRDGSTSLAQALVMILLANAVMLARVLLLVAVAAPELVASVAAPLVAALALALPAVAWHWRRAGPAIDEDEGPYKNPTELRAALGFAAIYACVLMLAEWARGGQGLYALAVLAGLTDVDAITLSVARLNATGSLEASVAAKAIALAVGANLLVKVAIVAVAGGKAAGARAAASLALPLAALLLVAS